MMRKEQQQQQQQRQERQQKEQQRQRKNTMFASFLLAMIIFLNALIYFVCQTIASTCLTQVIARFPLQIVSIIPFQVKRTTDQLIAEKSESFIGSNTAVTLEASGAVG